MEDAFSEDNCVLCVASNHPPCEKYTVVEYLNREHIPLGEDAIDHTVCIPVCHEHYRVLEAYRKGKSVGEIERVA